MKIATRVLLARLTILCSKKAGFVALLFLCLGSGVRAFAQTCGSVGTNAFVGCYYKGNSFSNPVMARTDNKIDFNWYNGSPASSLPVDSFSARWRGKFKFAAGEYEFAASSDDGMTVKVDGKTLTQSWYGYTPTAKINLAAGEHLIEVDYYENYGNAYAKVNWRALNSTSPPTPTPPPTSSTSVSCTDTGTNSFVGCYHKGNSFSSPVMARADDKIDFDWGSGSPASSLPVDSFSVRWRGKFKLAAGEYEFSASSDDGMIVKVDGKTITQSWFGYNPTARINLPAGEHLIEVDYNENYGGAYAKVSWKALGTSSTSPTTTPTSPSREPASSSLNEALVDKNATFETAALFHNLRNRMGQGLLFGHQFTSIEGMADGGFSDKTGTKNRSDVKSATGYFPAVYGEDFLTGLHGGYGMTMDDLASQVKIQYQRGGIITISWHANNPLTGGGYFDSDTTPLKDIVQTGTSANAVWRGWLDKIADFAKNRIVVNGVQVPIIFRPFHEHDGPTFWWGSKNSAEAYKTAWRYTVDYLRGKGVHNFLYAYSPGYYFGYDPKYEAYNRYPGDDYVDIIGFDIYDQNKYGTNYYYDVRYSAQMAVKFADQRGKVAALTEFGPDLKGIQESSNGAYYMDLLRTLRDDPVAKRLAWVLTWRNGGYSHYFVPVRGDIYFNSFQSFFNDPFTIFQNNMKSYYTSP